MGKNKDKQAKYAKKAVSQEATAASYSKPEPVADYSDNAPLSKLIAAPLFDTFDTSTLTAEISNLDGTGFDPAKDKQNLRDTRLGGSRLELPASAYKSLTPNGMSVNWSKSAVSKSNFFRRTFMVECMGYIIKSNSQ
jgi:hypothetical protein